MSTAKQINRDDSNWRTNLCFSQCNERKRERKRMKVRKNTYNPKWNDRHKHFVNMKFTGKCACVYVDLFPSKLDQLPTSTRSQNKYIYVQNCVTIKTLNVIFVYCIYELLDFASVCVWACACAFRYLFCYFYKNGRNFIFGSFPFGLNNNLLQRLSGNHSFSIQPRNESICAPTPYVYSHHRHNSHIIFN